MKWCGFRTIYEKEHRAMSDDRMIGAVRETAARGASLMRELAGALEEYQAAGWEYGDTEPGFLQWARERHPEKARGYETALRLKRAALFR